jgi:hypothetical protein
MLWEDYDQVPGFPAVATRVYRRRARSRSYRNWRHRKTKPLWYRALKARGSLR